MTTTKRRKTRGRKSSKTSPITWRYFMHGKQPESSMTDDERWEEAMLLGDRRGPETGMTAGELWNKQKPAIMRTWLRQHSGRRPFAWWRFDAPEPRRRLGGTGTPWHECLAAIQMPMYERGLPVNWLSGFQAQYYRGEAVNIHGEPVGRSRHDGTPRKPDDFKGVAPDPTDPPLFESEAAYLDRLGLLTDEERDKLTPADFEPVTLPAEYWPTHR